MARLDWLSVSMTYLRLCWEPVVHWFRGSINHAAAIVLAILLEGGSLPTGEQMRNYIGIVRGGLLGIGLVVGSVQV